MKFKLEKIYNLVPYIIFIKIKIVDNINNEKKKQF